MRIITSEQISHLNISPRQCVDWVREAFMMKYRCQLPPKISLHPQGTDFINTMPCILPEEYHTFGCKVVSRIAGRHPALSSDMMVLDSKTGEFLALVNCDWITAMRTGAVAALAINTLCLKSAHTFSFIGMGAMGRATLECFLSIYGNKNIEVQIKRYKDHAENIVTEYAPKYPNVQFSIADTIEQLVRNADVIVSAVTEANSLIVEDVSLFKPGVLVVPVHTRGFQNCDTVFDKVYADDRDHVKGFKYFNQFRQFDELSQVLLGANPGRESDSERILSYNIGLGLHDVYFATKILDRI